MWLNRSLKLDIQFNIIRKPSNIPIFKKLRGENLLRNTFINLIQLPAVASRWFKSFSFRICGVTWYDVIWHISPWSPLSAVEEVFYYLIYVPVYRYDCSLFSCNKSRLSPFCAQFSLVQWFLALRHESWGRDNKTSVFKTSIFYKNEINFTLKYQLQW